jgi:hypothetical protein
MIVAITHFHPENLHNNIHGKWGMFKLALSQAHIWFTGVAKAIHPMVDVNTCRVVDVKDDDAKHATIIFWFHGVTSSNMQSRVEELHKVNHIPLIHVNVSIDYTVDPSEKWPSIPDHMLTAFRISKDAPVFCIDRISQAIVQSYGFNSLLAVSPTQLTSDNPRIGQKAHDNWTETPIPSLRLGVFLPEWNDDHTHVLKAMLHAMYRYKAICFGNKDANLANTLYISKPNQKPFYKQYKSTLLSIFPGQVEFEMTMMRQQKLFCSIEELQTYLKDHIDFLVTLDVHSLTMAIQLGVPGICVCLNEQSRNACEELHVPWIWHDDLNRTRDLLDVFEDFEWHAPTYDEQRIIAADTYVRLLTDLGIPVSQHLQTIASTVL